MQSITSNKHCKFAKCAVLGIIIGSATQKYVSYITKQPQPNKTRIVSYSRQFTINKDDCMREHIQRELNLSSPLCMQISRREILEKINELLIWCNPMPYQPERRLYLNALIDHICDSKEVSNETREALRCYVQNTRYAVSKIQI
jgi:phage-related protein